VILVRERQVDEPERQWHDVNVFLPTEAIREADRIHGDERDALLTNILRPNE
jgi:hypothetical protein